MLPFLLAGALIAAQPATCPSDLLVQNPRLKVVRATDRTLDNYIVSVEVLNRGTADQRTNLRQHLDVLVNQKPAGTQPVPGLGANEVYPAAFRFQLPHQRHRKPVVVTFHYVMDDKARPGENCTTANDQITATL
jgi:hypothetical protein